MKATPIEIKLAVLLETDMESPFLPSDKTVDKLLQIKYAKEYLMQPNGSILVFQMPLDEYNQQFADDLKMCIEEVCNEEEKL